MKNGQAEIITSVERRRRWGLAEKQRLVAATLEPGASVSALAREAGIHPSQLYGWRLQLHARPQIGFAQVEIAAQPAPAGLGGGGAIVTLRTEKLVSFRARETLARGCPTKLGMT